MLPGDEGVWDNYRVKKTLIHSWLVFINLIFRDYLVYTDLHRAN